MEMQTYVLRQTNRPSIKFKGELVAKASSSPDSARCSFSGTTGVWQQLSLYRVHDGRLIAYKRDLSQWIGAKANEVAQICSNIQEVQNFFGYDWLAKELYEEAGIDCSIEV